MTAKPYVREAKRLGSWEESLAVGQGENKICQGFRGQTTRWVGDPVMAEKSETQTKYNLSACVLAAWRLGCCP